MAEKFGFGAVNNILKRKREIISQAEDNCHPSAKRVRVCTSDDLNNQLWQWYVAARAKKIPISGPIIQFGHALRIAEQLSYRDFKASNGWLEKFRTRHNISFKILSGNSASVDSATVETKT